jgi:hypothetical protein
MNRDALPWWKIRIESNDDASSTPPSEMYRVGDEVADSIINGRY